MHDQGMMLRLYLFILMVLKGKKKRSERSTIKKLPQVMPLLKP